jgi:hypothetical protein
VCFKGWADFEECRFVKGVGFGGAQFESRAMFDRASFRADSSFEGAVFERARTFGFATMTFDATLRLDRAVFEAPLRLWVSGGQLSCEGTQFLGRTSMGLSKLELTLADAEFAQPSVIEGMIGAAALPDANAEDLRRGQEAKPRLMSLVRANVGNLVLAEVDLRHCKFAGAHNLDKLRFEGVNDLLPSKRWRTKRRVIREERDLPERGLPRQRAAMRNTRRYRALRKGREDNKDEPGAADFYYGEMEMRRKAWRRPRQDRGNPATSWVEWVVLTLYWLVSGYGLRATRAVAALLVVTAAAAYGLDSFGFSKEVGYGDSLLFSAESTSSLFRAPKPPDGATLTDGGHVVHMLLRLLGPLFFGLALLAVRGRVKR